MPAVNSLLFHLALSPPRLQLFAMGLELPPGIAFLIQRIPQIFGPIIAIYITFSALITWDVIPFASKSPLLSSTGSKLFFSVAVMPVFMVARVWVTDILNQRRAHALGARLPVRYEAKRWGGLDLIVRLTAHNTYIGWSNSLLLETPS